MSTRSETRTRAEILIALGSRSYSIFSSLFFLKVGLINHLLVQITWGIEGDISSVLQLARDSGVHGDGLHFTSPDPILRFVNRRRKPHEQANSCGCSGGVADELDEDSAMRKTFLFLSLDSIVLVFSGTLLALAVFRTLTGSSYPHHLWQSRSRLWRST